MIPERHQNSIEVLATAEHEQFHDHLARQTTHGILVAFGVRYGNHLPSTENKLKQEIMEGVDRLMEDGRALHEGFAVYKTLRVTHLYAPLIAKLPPEYCDYLQQAEKIIPVEFRENRTGLVFLYGSIIAALSLMLPPPISTNHPSEAFFFAVDHISGCMSRWNRIQKKVETMGERLIGQFQHALLHCGMTEPEIQYPLVSEELVRCCPDVDKLDQFHAKERKAVEFWAEQLGALAFGDESKVATLSTLANVVAPYRDLLAPGYRLTTSLPDRISISLEQYSEIYGLLHEAMYSELGIEVMARRHYAVREEAAARVLKKTIKLLPQPHRYIGYLRDSLPHNVPEYLMDDKGRPESTYNIEWVCACPNLTYYCDHKLDLLVTTNPRAFWEQLEDTVKKRLGVFASPAMYHQDTYSQSLLDDIHASGGRVALFLPVNLLDLLEWRQLRGLAKHPIKINFSPTEITDCYLMSCYFDRESIPYLKLVGPSTVLGVSYLLTLNVLDIDVSHNENTMEDSVNIDWVNFLRVFWK